MEDDRIRPEWEQLYERLRAALRPHGTDDAFGDGSFWLVDDDWGGQHQKLGVTDRNAWTPEVVAAVQQALRSGFQHWGVIVMFDDGSERRHQVVYHDGVDAEARWK